MKFSPSDSVWRHLDVGLLGLFVLRIIPDSLPFDSSRFAVPPGPPSWGPLPTVMLRDRFGELSPRAWQTRQGEPVSEPTHIGLATGYYGPALDPVGYPNLTPLYYGATDLSGRELISRRYWGYPVVGDLSREFGDLVSFAEGLENLPVHDLASVLANTRRREGERVEILGLSVPHFQISWFGMIILLIIQGYFLADLMAFARAPGRRISEVPWIGTYEGLFPRILFIITAALLPTVAGFVLWERAYEGLGRKLLFPLFLVTAVLATATACWRERALSRISSVR